MQALIIESRGRASLTRAPLPSLRDGGYILVKTAAVALNPSDWKHINHMLVGDPTGTRPGLDFAGTVVEVGHDVERNDVISAGDRVFGICHGANVRQPHDGAFAEYVVAKACFAIKVPDGMEFTEAAAMGTGLAAVAQGLYQDLKLPLPTAPTTRRTPILIYGGSTASGVMGIQFAKRSGCVVYTTCSPKNFAYLTQQVGADFCFDYRDKDCAGHIHQLTRGRLRHAWDCITTLQSARVCAEALSASLSSHYSSLLFISPAAVRQINPRVRCSTTIGYTILGEEFEKETTVETRVGDFEFGKMFWRLAEKMLHNSDGEEKRIHPVKQTVNLGGEGLDGVLHGLECLKQGKISASKLVYTL